MGLLGRMGPGGRGPGDSKHQLSYARALFTLSTILLNVFYCPDFLDDRTDGYRGNLLKVKQLVTGYTSLVVYEQYPGDI